MKQTWLILILFTSSFAFCQGKPATIPVADLSMVKQSFSKLIAAFEQNDINALEAICHLEISCDYCEERYITSKTLLNEELKDFKQTKIYTAYIKRGISITTENFTSPGNQPIYVVWIQSLLPNEYAKGHEGASFGFQFSEDKGQYKLYGLTSVP